MRVYRWVILASLAGLTVVLLGTAVYAMQVPSASSITYNEFHKQTPQALPLRAPKQGADYLAIVADEPGFLEALLPLLAYREGTGLLVTAVSLAQIASEFGDGEATPQAIREFLAYTATNWQPAPQFVLLVGDAAVPVSNANKNLLPTYLQETETGSFVANDGWFVMQGDVTSDVSIGRFPVQTASEITAVVHKTIAYETSVAHLPNPDWLHRALVVADDEPYFDMATEQLEDNLDHSGYRIHDLHMSHNQDIYADIVTILNRGVGIFNYAGHGNETSFADGTAFTAQDAHLLENEQRLPIFTAFSCENGAFSDPTQESLAEKLLFAENGGIVAAIGTSGQTAIEDSLALSTVFYEQLLHGEAKTLGEALTETKTAVHDDVDLKTAVLTYNLLGDPALHLYHPPQSENPIPISTTISDTSTFISDR